MCSWQLPSRHCGWQAAAGTARLLGLLCQELHRRQEGKAVLRVLLWGALCIPPAPAAQLARQTLTVALPSPCPVSTPPCHGLGLSLARLRGHSNPISFCFSVSCWPTVSLPVHAPVSLALPWALASGGDGSPQLPGGRSKSGGAGLHGAAGHCLLGQGCQRGAAWWGGCAYRGVRWLGHAQVCAVAWGSTWPVHWGQRCPRSPVPVQGAWSSARVCCE